MTVRIDRKIEGERKKKRGRENKIITFEQLVNLGEYMANHCTVLQIFCRFNIFQNKQWGKIFR